MRSVRWFVFIFVLVVVAAAVVGFLVIVLPQSGDSRLVGWIVYGVGGVVILLAYLRRKRGERNPSDPEELPRTSSEFQGAGRNEPDRTMEQVRGRIRLRKTRKDRSDT